jgi:hypothetical protein
MGRRKFLCLNPPGDPLTLAQQEIGVLFPPTLSSIPQLLEPAARARHLGAPPPSSRSPIPRWFSRPHDPVPGTRPNQGTTPPPILGAPDRQGDRPKRRSHPKQRANHHAQGRRGTFRAAQEETTTQQHRGALGKSASRSETPLAPKGRLNRVAMRRKPVEKQPRASETMENSPDLASATSNTAPLYRTPLPVVPLALSKTPVTKLQNFANPLSYNHLPPPPHSVAIRFPNPHPYNHTNARGRFGPGHARQE